MDYIDFQTAPSMSSNNPIGRIDSGETDDSPFASNLVTPTDEQILPALQHALNSSIDQRIIIAKALDYFTSGELEEGIIKEKEVAVEVYPTTSPEVNLSTDSSVGYSAGQSVIGGDEQTDPMSAEDRDADTSTFSTFDSSQGFPSPHPSELELLAQARRRSSALYSLPNTHILVDKAAPGSNPDEADDTIIQEDYLPVLDDLEPTPDLLFALSWPADVRTWMDQLTMLSVFTLSARILLFLPWCIAVGGAIVLSPAHLSSLGFTSILNYISPPSTAIEHFAHWANYGLQHVTIFLGFVIAFLWMFPNAGLICLGALMAQFCWAWHDFLPDRTVAIGENERQMVYLLAKNSWLKGITVGLKTVDGRFYVAHSELAAGGSGSELNDSEE